MGILSGERLDKIEMNTMVDLRRKLEELSSLSKDSRDLIAKLENAQASFKSGRKVEGGKGMQLYVMRTDELAALKKTLNELSAEIKEITGGFFGKSKINKVIQSINDTLSKSN